MRMILKCPKSPKKKTKKAILDILQMILRALLFKNEWTTLLRIFFY